MYMHEILPALALPAAVKYETVTKRSLLADGCRHPGDRRRIVSGIETFYWLAANVLSTGVRPHVRPEREYHDIGIFGVAVHPGAELALLAEAIHSTVPNPAVIFFVREGEVCEISIAHKRRVTDTRQRIVIDGFSGAGVTNLDFVS